MADGALDAGGGGLIFLCDGRIEDLGHTVDDIRVANGHENGGAEVLIAFDVGRHADLVDDLGHLGFDVGSTVAATRDSPLLSAGTDTADALVEECTDADAIAEETAKLALNFPKEKLLLTPTSAVGMKGRVSFDTYRENARLNLSVADSRGYGVSYLYFDRLIAACGGGRVSPHPIMQGRYCGILAGGISVTETVITDTGDKVIDSSEFVDRSAYLTVKSRVERLKLLAEGALDEADIAFREAGEAHMNIEEIFISAMDFAAKEEYSRDLCAKIARGDL